MTASDPGARHSVASFRSRVTAKESLIGTFVKTPAYQNIEVLGTSGLDFVVLDAEHAPFDRGCLDTCCLAAKAYELPALVRTAGSNPQHVLEALDLGATGVLIPHVNTVDTAVQISQASRYREANGQRGYSNSPRAGGYGRTPMSVHVEQSDQQTTLIAQIETAAAVDAAEGIASVPGIDALFIGRADLALSYRVDRLDHPILQEAVEHICHIGQKTGTALGMFLPDASDISTYQALGVSFFVIASDQTLLRQAASGLTGKGPGR